MFNSHTARETLLVAGRIALYTAGGSVPAQCSIGPGWVARTRTSLGNHASRPKQLRPFCVHPTYGARPTLQILWYWEVM